MTEDSFKAGQDEELDLVLKFIVRTPIPNHLNLNAESYQTWLTDQLADLRHRVSAPRLVKVRLSSERLHVALGLDSSVNIAEVTTDSGELELTLHGPDFPPVEEGQPIPVATVIQDTS